MEQHMGGDSKFQDRGKTCIKKRKKKKLGQLKQHGLGFFFAVTHKTEEYQDSALPARGIQVLATWIVPCQGLLLH